jgi:hypothetical protein
MKLSHATFALQFLVTLARRFSFFATLNVTAPWDLISVGPEIRFSQYFAD